jgi:ubiquinone/menaquinone biosynthesis C-methylase UbiE
MEATMTRMEQMALLLRPYLEGKTLCEVACGGAGFTMLNAPFVRKALATDFSLQRAPKENIPSNVTFKQMDAKQIGSLDERFDVVAICNSLSHIESVLMDSLEGIHKILVDKGLLIIVASWRMDKRIFDPLLQSRPFREHFSLKQRITKGAIEGMLLEKKV